jgi:hypothetical protein
MVHDGDALVTEYLGQFVGCGLLLGIGTLLVCYGVRDFFLLLNGFTFGTSGYGVDAVRVVVACAAGGTLALAGVATAGRLALVSTRDRP